MNKVKFTNCIFIQTDTPIDETEEFLRPEKSDSFDNCTFYIRKGRAAVNYSMTKILVMKWKAKIPPENNDERIIETFLLIPIKLENQWRWLEKAKIKQVYCDMRCCWQNRKWVN